jgi:hypothetical protein
MSRPVAVFPFVLIFASLALPLEPSSPVAGEGGDGAWRIPLRRCAGELLMRCTSLLGF